MTTSAFQEPVMQSLLEKIARDEGFKQPQFEIELGSKPGDNFIGRIFRAVIIESESSKRLSLIFKASPLSKLRKKIQTTDEIFQVETDVYQIILPTFNNLLNKNGDANANIFPGTPRCFAAHISKPNCDDCHVVVLEDKSVDGFRMFRGKNRILDAEHCRLALKKVSLWHATSMALRYHDSKTAEKLEKLLRREGVPPLSDENHPMYDELIPNAELALKDFQECCQIEEIAYRKTEALVRNYRKELITVNYMPPPDVFCITHGDLWTNNVLFKYRKDGSLDDACLLDFQFVRLGSPAIDVAYLLFLCTSKEFRDAHYYELLQYYHSELCSNLSKLDCDSEKIFPWQLFEEHLKRYARIAVLAGLVFVPIFGAGSSNIQFDVHESGEGGNHFVGNVVDSINRRETVSRLVDVIEDSCRLGYM